MEQQSNTQGLEIKAKFYDLFDDREGDVTSLRSYYGYFEKIPCYKLVKHIDFQKVKNWVETTQQDSIVQKYYKEIFQQGVKTYFQKIIYVLKDEIMISITIANECYILFKYGDDAKADVLLNEVRKFGIRKKRETYFCIVVHNGREIELTPLKNINPKLSLEKNYNDDIIPMHDCVIKNLRKKNGSGLILFHGSPGTGKSTYIRHLIHCLNSTRVIFLPPRIAGSLDSPELISILLKNPNSILVIEEAENLLISRDVDHNSNISMLLNITDGLLGASLNIKVICTFNTNVSNIDKALL